MIMVCPESCTFKTHSSSGIFRNVVFPKHLRYEAVSACDAVSLTCVDDLVSHQVTLLVEGLLTVLVATLELLHWSQATRPLCRLVAVELVRLQQDGLLESHRTPVNVTDEHWRVHVHECVSFETTCRAEGLRTHSACEWHLVRVQLQVFAHV